MSKKKEIHIYISGGALWDVSGIPKGYSCIVTDKDIQKTPMNYLKYIGMC
jgi:hypothetical protein